MVFQLYILGGKFKCLKEFLSYFKLQENYPRLVLLILINQIHQIPVSINLFFSLISIGSKNTHLQNKKLEVKNLCEALQGMGTTFIKLDNF